MPDRFETTANLIADGVGKTIKNAVQLCKEAKLLLDGGGHARALSLSILAIEEIGKVIMIDSLVFAVVGDKRAKRFHDGFARHRSKLEAAASFPLAVPYFYRFEATGKNQGCLQTTCAIALHNWSQEKNKLMKLLGEDCAETQWIVCFTRLNRYKQAGFYVDKADSKGFLSPEAMSPDLARATFSVAWRMAEGLDFLIGSNTSLYTEWVVAARTRLGTDGALELRQLVENAMTDQFNRVYEALSK